MVRLRQMTLEEMEEKSRQIGIPHPEKVKKWGIVHYPSPAYVALWLIEESE